MSIVATEMGNFVSKIKPEGSAADAFADHGVNHTPADGLQIITVRAIVHDIVRVGIRGTGCGIQRASENVIVHSTWQFVLYVGVDRTKEFFAIVANLRLSVVVRLLPRSMAMTWNMYPRRRSCRR